MCGRFTLRTSAREIAKTFGLIEVPDPVVLVFVGGVADFGVAWAVDGGNRSDISRIWMAGGPPINRRSLAV